MKMRLVLAALGATSIIGIVSLMTHPALSQVRPTPTSPSQSASPPPSSIAPANKLTVPQPKITADREKMNTNPNSGASFDIKKDQKQKSEERKKQKILDDRDEAADKAAAKKKKEIKKNAAESIRPTAVSQRNKKATCTSSCKSDPCGCNMQFMPAVAACSPSLPGCAFVQNNKDGERSSCKAACTKSVSTCQSTC